MVQFWYMYPLGTLYKQSQINGYLCISVYDVNKALCSFTETDKTPHYQHMYECNDCKISTCIVCSNVCHNGHDIVYEEYKKTYCECGVNTQTTTGSCKALTTRTSRPCSLIEIQTSSPSELTSILIGDQKTLQHTPIEGDSSSMAENNENDSSSSSLAVPLIGAYQEQGDNSFMQKNNENDTNTIFSLAVPVNPLIGSRRGISASSLKNKHIDTSKMISRTEFLEVINRQSIAMGTIGFEPPIQDEAEELLKRSRSEDRIDVE